MIRPHGPNCWMGLGAFKDLVLLQSEKKKKRKVALEDDCRVQDPALLLTVRTITVK